MVLNRGSEVNPETSLQQTLCIFCRSDVKSRDFVLGKSPDGRGDRWNVLLGHGTELRNFTWIGGVGTIGLFVDLKWSRR